ncbi:AzlC family ABC transporter permease [Caballeronia calidae]|uniref:AzlC family ABC transporter permease n=1 Tax=Caballeronia calidae TaxID=1777139 RepID=UPI0035B5017D
MDVNVSRACEFRRKPKENLNAYRRGLVSSLPVVVAMIPFAMVLGAQAAQKGLSTLEVSLMTGLNFAGGSEFAAVGLWTSPPHMLLIVAITFLVNCRHILMGASLTPFLSGMSGRKVLPALFLMCDESWAMGLADAQARSSSKRHSFLNFPYYIGCSAPLYVTWIAFTTLGSIFGPALGNIERYGFDMAFPAVFLVIIRGMWKGFRAARPWIVSLGASVATYLLLPGAWYVAAGAACGLIGAYVLADEK